MDLVERGEEFSIMQKMLASCEAGHGGVLLVSGAVASGKTALLRAFGERATAAGALYLQATASAAESDLPLGVMGQLLLGGDPLGADAGRAARIVDLMAEPGPSGRARGVRQGVPMGEIPELCSIVLEMARERPVLLSIDDVHHADSESLECLLYLARRLDVSRILVVLGENNGFLAGNPRLRVDLLRLPGCRNIRLGPLQRHGVAEMISGFGGPGWRTRKLVSDVHRIGGGSPLLTRALIEDHRATVAGSGTSADLVPGESFVQAVATGLYRSDPATRRTAWALAVAGPEVTLAELGEALASSRESLHRSLRALNEAGLLDAGWFRHEAGRAAVLRSIEPADRARLEARVARVLHEHGAAATVVVQHLIAAETVEAPWALRTLIEAAERALADDEVELALTCLRVARDTCSDPRQALEIRAALTRAGWRVNPATVDQHLPELGAAALEGRLGARDTGELVGHLLWFGRFDRALDVLSASERHGVVACGRTAPGGPRGHDCPRGWLTYAYPGMPASARACFGPTPEHAQAAEHAPGLARSPHQRAASLMKAVLDGAGDDVVVRAEQILQSTRLDDRTLTALLVALHALVLADRLDAAAFWCETLFNEAAERRAPMWQALLASAKARVELRAGALLAADASARSALALVPAEGWGVAVASPIATAVFTRTALGRIDEAAAQLGVPVPDAAFQTPDGLLYLRARGHYYLAAGRPYAALDDFLTCGDLMTRWEFDLPALVPWRTDAAQAHLRLGDAARARALAEEQLALVGPGGSAARAVSLRVLASTLVAGRRVGLLGEAVEILTERGHRLDLARATDELARAQRELGKVGQARSLARKAQQLAGECGIPVPGVPPKEGAGTLAAERPWPPGPRRNPVELSNAELRVATLAVRGYTNRQIADKLCITVSTVEQHLTRAYRKLDVQRRADLAAKLSPHTGPGGREGPASHDDCDRLHVV
ncbi:ATP-binding protein [Streptomyces formicae]|uniref:LuxR-family transcriptional regulator n=1 Tax=Streptomyces formicae TaxID=1616117 RepID=A0A291QLK4_9ACTN|nr:LuxR family transcriptional regulator [Streptomyces formicae]ATL32417.1 LuxR-family transcriptional regulator [Streptomyces formicae]